MKRFLLLGVLAGCGEHSPPARPWSGLATALKSASVAEVWRIAGDAEKHDYFSYPETAGPVELGTSLRKEMTGLLSDPKAIGDVAVAPCKPAPGIKARFIRPNGVPVWVFFCFECREIFVYEGKQLRECKGFDHGAQELAAVMKNIFPGDPVIQNLK